MIYAYNSCTHFLQLTFGIGCMTSLPGVRLFCLYTFWGITFTYLYQITYFTAVLAYSGEMEDKGIHSLFGKKCIHLESAGNFRLIYLYMKYSRHQTEEMALCWIHLPGL